MVEQNRRQAELVRVKSHHKDGSKKKQKAFDEGQWVWDTVQTLLRHNHTLAEIAEYPLDRVMALLEASRQVEAKQRVEFITDMSQVVGGIFGSGESFTEHIEFLQSIANGE